MNLNRRDFLILTVAAAAGCSVQNNAAGPGSSGSPTIIDAGPLSNYSTDGVYSQFRDQGFFIVRSGEKLFALSSLCTHSACKVNAQADRSFLCKCHGSTFDPNGKVTKGPAEKDLPNFPASTGNQRHLYISINSI